MSCIAPFHSWVDFHAEKHRNDTHESTTDPDSPPMRKSLKRDKHDRKKKLSGPTAQAWMNVRGLSGESAVALSNITTRTGVKQPIMAESRAYEGLFVVHFWVF